MPHRGQRGPQPWTSFVNWKGKVKVAQPCPTLRPRGLYSPWNSPGQNTGVGSLSLLQGIFPTHGLNPSHLHCRWILFFFFFLQVDSLPVEPQGKPKNTGVGSLSLLQRIFPTQEWNRSLLHCRRILYQLSYEGSYLSPNSWLLFHILFFWLSGTRDLSFLTRYQTCTPCIGRRSLNHLDH